MGTTGSILLYIGGFASALTAVITCCVLCLRPIRKGLVRTFGTNKAQLALLRNEITAIYYKYLPAKGFPSYVKKNLVMLHEAYMESGGNSYVCQIYKDMMGWSVTKERGIEDEG